MPAFFSDAERRIKKLYERYKIGIMPWTWDYDRYGGKNKDMYGMFYMDDLADIEALEEFERSVQK